MLQSENVYCSLSPIYFFSRIFAVSSFSTSRNGFKTSISGMFYSFLCGTLFFYHTFLETMSRDTDGSKIFVIMDLVYVTESIFTTVVSFFCAIIYAKKIIHWTDKVHKHDKMMEAHFKNVNYLRSHRKIRIFSLVSSGLVVLQNSITFIIDVLGFLPTTVTIGDTNGVLTYTIPLCTSSFLILQFCGCMLVMKERFRWINQELEALVRTWKRDFKTRKLGFVMEHYSDDLRYDEGLFTDILEKLRMRYYHIHSLTEELNDIFAISSLLTVLQCFLSLLVYIMYLIKGLNRATWYKTIMYRCFCGAVLLNNVIKLITLTYTSSFLTREATKTEAILHQIESTSEDINDFVQHFSYQIMQLKTEITACSMFTIDRSLLYEVAGLVTSYLVLCIQLDI